MSTKRSRPSSPLAEQPGVPRAGAPHPVVNATDQDQDEGGSDTLAVLGAKLTAVGKVNDEILETIKSHRDAVLCKGFEFSIGGCLDGSGANDDRKPSVLLGQDTVEKILAAWRYGGEPLEALDENALLKNGIDYKLKNAKDVLRLNEEILTLGRLHQEMLAAWPGVRKRMRTLLANMEKVQVAIGELHELVRSSMEAWATKEHEAIIREELEAALSNISKRISIPNASVSLKTSIKVNGSQREKNPVSFENPENLSCRTVLDWGAVICNVNYFASLAVFSQHGSSFLALGFENGCIDLVDIDRQARVGRLNHFENDQGFHDRDPLALVAFEIDAVPHLASASFDSKAIQVWDLSTRTIVKTLEGHSQGVLYSSSMVHFEEDGHPYLATSCEGGFIRVWDLTTGTRVRELRSHHFKDTDGAFLDHFEFGGNAFLAVASSSERDGDSVVQIWEQSGRSTSSILKPYSHAKKLRCFKYYEQEGNPYLACGSEDGKIYLWDLQKGELAGTLRHGVSDYIYDLAVFHQGDKPCLASVASGGSKRIWDLARKRLITNLDDGDKSRADLECFWYNGQPCLVSGSLGKTPLITLWTELEE